MWNLARAKFAKFARGIFGDFRPQNTKICQKISKVANFFTPQGRIPGPILVKFMCYMCVTCLRNVLKFGAIWFINDKVVGKKTAMGHFPQFFSPLPLAPKLLVERKMSRWENGFFLVVCFLFVFLFVMLTVCVSLGYRHAHCEGYIVAIYRCSFQRF